MSDVFLSLLLPATCKNKKLALLLGCKDCIVPAFLTQLSHNLHLHLSCSYNHVNRYRTYLCYSPWSLSHARQLAHVQPQLRLLVQRHCMACLTAEMCCSWMEICLDIKQRKFAMALSPCSTSSHKQCESE